jgi:hypothetical protein
MSWVWCEPAPAVTCRGRGFVNRDSPVAVEQCGDVGGAHVVVWVEAVGSGLRSVDGLVVHDEKRSAVRDRCEQRVLGVMVFCVQQRGVLGGHQVEGPWRQLGFHEAGLHPAHRNSRVLGVTGSALERHLGHIESGDVPPALSEPDGVGTFAAADVEGLAGLESGCLADERLVGLAAPDLLHAGTLPKQQTEPGPSPAATVTVAVAQLVTLLAI